MRPSPLEASRTNNSDGDDFVFEYSVDGVNWLPLATVASATEQVYSAALGVLSGAVTVRVTVRVSSACSSETSLPSCSAVMVVSDSSTVVPVRPSVQA